MRTIEELIAQNIERGDMTPEEELSFVEHWFSKYEKAGFCDTFTTPYEQYREKVGQKFTVTRRCTTEEDESWDLCALPAWHIKLEDGTCISAYPEEICLLENKDGVPTEETPMEISLTTSEIKAIAVATKKQWLGMVDNNGQAKNPVYQAFADCMYNTMRKFEDMLPTPTVEG